MNAAVLILIAVTAVLAGSLVYIPRARWGWVQPVLLALSFAALVTLMIVHRARY